MYPTSVSGTTWDAARAFARHAISMRGVLAHIVDIHHIIHAFAPAVEHMPKNHPIAQLMRHSIDDIGLRVLVEVLLSPDIRSEESRVGKECVSTCGSRWSAQ